MTRRDLREAVYRTCPTLSAAEVREVVAATIEEITETLLSGENVKLREFGTFEVREKSERRPKSENSCRVSHHSPPGYHLHSLAHP